MDPQIILALAGSGAVGIIGYLLLSGSSGSSSSARVASYTGKETLQTKFLERFKSEDRGDRRKQIEDSLKKIRRPKRRKPSLLRRNSFRQTSRLHAHSLSLGLRF